MKGIITIEYHTLRVCLGPNEESVEIKQSCTFLHLAHIDTIEIAIFQSDQTDLELVVDITMCCRTPKPVVSHMPLVY